MVPLKKHTHYDTLHEPYLKPTLNPEAKTLNRTSPDQVLELEILVRLGNWGRKSCCKGCIRAFEGFS